MKCAALLSGGKDGWLALWYALSSGLSVERGLTFSPQKLDSFMFHGINSKFVGKQTELAGIKHSEVRTSGEKENDEEALVRAFRILEGRGFEGVVSGAVESEYQRERVERACAESGLVHFSPLWRKKQELLLEEFLESGHDALIVAVAADGMGREWLGRRISEHADGLIELRERQEISPIGEGGEFETFVVKSPMFKREIKVGKSEVLWDGNSGFLKVESVK